MNYRIIPVTAFSQNCSLIWCEQPVWPHWSIRRRCGKNQTEVDDSGLTLMQILLTHGHLDHVGAAAELAQHCNVPVSARKKKMSSGCKACLRKVVCLSEECQPLDARIVG